MAIDLPPALPPQLTIPSTIVEASQSGGAYTRRIGDYALQLSGAHYLSPSELDQVFTQATTPSEAIILMNAWTHRRGYLVVQYLYTRPINGVIHVRAIQKTVGKVSGSDAITPFLKNREDDSTPTRAEFVRDTAFANAVSNRTGIDYSISFREQEADRNTLDLLVKPNPSEQHSRWHGSLQLGNQGSRFVGRYFANAAMSRDFDSGARVSAAYQRAIPQWGEAGDGDDFSSVQFLLSQPSRFGYYELDAQQTQYDRQIDFTSGATPACSLAVLGQCLLPGSQTQGAESTLSADINQVALRGQQVLKADIDYRWLVRQQLQWTDSTLEQATGEAIQQERYTTLELGTRYEQAQLRNEKTLNWTLGASIRGGLSGDSGTLATDRITEGVSVGKRTAEFLMLKPHASLSYAFAPNYQWTASFNAQFANEQLPQQQQWVLGGISTLRAYLPGVLVGDSGGYLSTSLVRTMHMDSVAIDFTLFAEYGAARYQDAHGKDFTGKVSFVNYSTLADAGIGATLRIQKHIEVSAIVARPIDKSNVDSAVVDQAEADFFVVIKASF